MPSNSFELIACIAIIAFMIYAIWRGGGSNPVGTGALQRQLNAIGAELRALNARLETFCSHADLEALRGEVERIEKSAASSGEIIALEGKVNVLNQKIEGWGGATRRVENMVQRIEGILVRKALGDD